MDREFRILRWVTFAALITVAVAYLLPLAQTNRTDLPAEVVLVVLAAGLLTWAIESWLRLLVNRAAPPAGQGKLAPDTRAILDLSSGLLAARNAQETLQVVMRTSCEVSGAQGCSFVPYDEWGKSFPALVYGKVPTDAMQTWVESLSSPSTRQVCKSCQAMGAEKDCLLLDNDNRYSVHCLTLTRQGRPVGVLNFYFKKTTRIEETQKSLLLEIQTIADAALQHAVWRDQSLTTLRQLQTGKRGEQDLNILLEGLVANLRQALDVDFGLIWLPRTTHSVAPTLVLGGAAQGADPAESGLPDPSFLEGVWQSVSTARTVLTLENVSLNAKDVWRSLLAVPLVWGHGEVAGLLLLGSRSQVVFNERQLMLVQTVAGETALLIQNAGQMAQVEFQAVVDERARLAREIHDGLAQTLAFLKMQSSQMQSYLEQGDLGRLTDALNSSGRTLADAYLDARQAIDQLRRVPGADLTSWLCQVAVDFEAASGLRVDTSRLDLDYELAPMTQAQLVRIVQEALSNIRKHAQAQVISISGRIHEDAFILEVSDDGRGFSPESVNPGERFGLRTMRERAEMLGADFQVISRPGAGATVRVRLPMEKVS